MEGDLPGPERPSQATVYQIAERAGVSIATVSRVVNGVGGIRPGTKAKVLSAIEELGYVPNGAAQGMARRATDIVGLVYRRRPLSATYAEGDTAGEAHADLLDRTQQSLVYYDQLIRGVEQAAYASDRMVLLRGAFSDVETAAVLSMTGKCDGLVFMDRVIPDADMPRIARRLPVASIAHFVDVPGVTSILIDNREAIRQLVDHMIVKHKAKRFAFLGGPVDSEDAVAREMAVRECLAEAGATLEQLEPWRGDYAPSTAFDVVRARCSAGSPLPDVIMCVNDGSAIGTLSALMSLGIKVPADVAVTGFDDMVMARHTTPPLTTVRQPLEDMARLAVEALEDQQARTADQATIKIVPPKMVVRRSCGCAARAVARAAITAL